MKTVTTGVSQDIFTCIALIDGHLRNLDITNASTTMTMNEIVFNDKVVHDVVTFNLFFSGCNSEIVKEELVYMSLMWKVECQITLHTALCLLFIMGVFELHFFLKSVFWSSGLMENV